MDCCVQLDPRYVRGSKGRGRCYHLESDSCNLAESAPHGDSCVVDVAPSNRPYIDKIHSQLGIAVAGNGYAAKSSDEIGRLAVELLMNGKWDIDVPKDLFCVKLKSGCGRSKL